jgi:hypothetical protein
LRGVSHDRVHRPYRSLQKICRGLGPDFREKETREKIGKKETREKKVSRKKNGEEEARKIPTQGREKAGGPQEKILKELPTELFFPGPVCR